MSISETLSWLGKLWPRAMPKPPFRHIVQAGEPSLRRATVEIDPAFIVSNEVSEFLKALEFVKRRYNACGISAPQIGVSYRVFVMGVDQNQKKYINNNEWIAREMELFPNTVFINPKLKILNYEKIIDVEACHSVTGYAADVPRYREVNITAYDEKANQFTINLKGYLARIAQHEMDHLDAKLYTDIMVKDSFVCTCWSDINKYEGKISMPFLP